MGAAKEIAGDGIANENEQDEIRLNEEEFWQFNDGANDRFGFFREEEEKRLRTNNKMFDRGTAYNYHRFEKDLEDTEWTMFYQDLIKQLFRRFDAIIISKGDQIFGSKGRSRELLTTKPGAFARAQIRKESEI